MGQRVGVMGKYVGIVVDGPSRGKVLSHDSDMYVYRYREERGTTYTDCYYIHRVEIAERVYGIWSVKSNIANSYRPVMWAAIRALLDASGEDSKACMICELSELSE